jgi:copper chaperone CopZ
MENVVIKVKNIKDEEGAKQIRRALMMFEGYERAKVDVAAGTVEIEFDLPATVSGFIAGIENAGFEVEK